jgi:lysophospholipase L1-like esterase
MKIDTTIKFDQGSYGVVLLDNFDGTGALTSHTPDIYPAGSAWAILNGTFGNLSGGFLPYTSGTFGKSTINCGLSDFELTWRSKFFSSAGSKASGVQLRGTGAAIGYVIGIYRSVGIDYIQWDIPGSAIIHSSQTGIGNSRILTLVDGNYYTWKLMIKGQHVRLWDEAGVLMLAASAAAKLTDTYVGTYNEQPVGNWDFIQVNPITERFITFSVCGDSISNDTGEWPFIVGANYNNGYSYPINHAVSGSGIIGQMAGQVAQCITDNADFTIIALGTNDGINPNMQTTYQTQLQTLWNALHKPIYACGVFPKTSTAERTTQNGYITAAIAVAQAAGVNVTYWNTNGWIEVGTDTADGLHPNSSGQIKIANEVLARI